MIDVWQNSVSGIRVVSKKESNPIEGDLYYNTTTCRNYVYSNGQWVELQINTSVYKPLNRKRKIRKIFNG